MGDRNLQEWISDQLHSLLGEPLELHFTTSSTNCLACTSPSRSVCFWQQRMHILTSHIETCAGYSAEAVVGYILALARKAPNVNILVSDLQSKASQAHVLVGWLVFLVHYLSHPSATPC